MKTRKLLIGCPSADGWYANMFAQLNAHAAHQEGQIFRCESRSSLVAYGFNKLWCTALNGKRTHGFTHFLLMHADVNPVEVHWMDTLFEEMESNGADILSAIIPIKDDRGLTSTGFDLGGWAVTRLTQKQVWSDQFPDTWTAENLLFNSGLMLVDLAGDWIDKVFFTINDRIIEKDGVFLPEVESEDWNFSRQCNKLGVRSFVTRKIHVEHYGEVSFHSDRIWGQDTDTANAEANFKVMETA